MTKGELIPIAKIIKLSGHSGELIISGPSFLKNIKDLQQPIFVELAGENVPFYIEEYTSINAEKTVVKLQYVNTAKKAEALLEKNVLIYSTDKKAQHLAFEWEGYFVVDEIQGELGELKFLDQTMKNPLLVIQHGTTEILIPYQEEFIIGVDRKEKILVVKCPPGLLELYLKNDEEE